MTSSQELDDGKTGEAVGEQPAIRNELATKPTETTALSLRVLWSLVLLQLAIVGFAAWITAPDRVGRFLVRRAEHELSEMRTKLVSAARREAGPLIQSELDGVIGALPETRERLQEQLVLRSEEIAREGLREQFPGSYYRRRLLGRAAEILKSEPDTERAANRLAAELSDFELPAKHLAHGVTGSLSRIERQLERLATGKDLNSRERELRRFLSAIQTLRRQGLRSNTNAAAVRSAVD